MQLQPEIKTLSETRLVGKRINMSFAANRTSELWRNFMPLKSRIKYAIGSDLYSIEIYPEDFFAKFDPGREFIKWAAVPVSKSRELPEDLQELVIPEGLYAVFPYKGKASEAAGTYQYIYSTWIPGSEYTLDHRPHFAVMGEKYKNEDPDSEEELWIPVRAK